MKIFNSFHLEFAFESKKHIARNRPSIKFRIQNPFKRTRNEQANSVQEWCLRKRDRRTWFPNSKLNKRNNSSHCLFSRMNRGVSLPSFFKRLSINYSDKLSFSYFSRAGTMAADSIRNLKGFNTFGELEEENASVMRAMVREQPPQRDK